MPITHFHVTHFRNLSNVSLKPLINGFNILYGHNGSGKTSLLESIYYLSTGKSFKSTSNERVIQHSAEKLSIFARLSAINEIPVGLERSCQGVLNIRMQEKEIKMLSEITQLLPVQLIDSHCHNLIEGSPAIRRKYLDWANFYARKDFFIIWRQYHKVLKQRNAALRKFCGSAELHAWTQELVKIALAYDQIRQQAIKTLLPHVLHYISKLLPLPDLDVSYARGWPKDLSLIDSFNQASERERALGYTVYGPHKADLKLSLNQVSLRDILSRGQQKLFVCAMMLARGDLLQDHVKSPIYLIDDLPSELDFNNRTKLITLLSKQKAQIFITTTEYESWGHVLFNEPMRLFHVEHGDVQEKDVSSAR